jgi:hypothetical protein
VTARQAQRRLRRQTRNAGARRQSANDLEVTDPECGFLVSSAGLQVTVTPNTRLPVAR